MIDLRRWTARAAGVAALGGLASVAGCSAVFGFEPPVLAHCLLSSDCGFHQICRSNVCTPECEGDIDCRVDEPLRPYCIEGACSPVPADAGEDVSNPPPPPPPPPEAGPPDVAAPDASDEERVCACFQSCVGQECSDDGHGKCPFTWYNPLGASRQGDVSQNLGFANATLWAVQIHIGAPGRLAALEMLAKKTDTRAISYYLSLYRDTSGGAPGARVWAPPGPSTLGPDPLQIVDVPCDPPVRVEEGYYWIVGTWDQGILIDYSNGTGKYVIADWPEFAAPPADFPVIRNQPTSDKAAEIQAIVLP